MPLAFAPLSPTLGVEIKGLDPRHMSADQVRELRALFHDRHLVLIRGLDLNDEETVTLAEKIGPVSSVGDTMKGGRKFTLISNVHVGGRLPDGELLFHTDHMYFESPLKAISLYAMQVTEHGGETRYIDMSTAYETLPADVKAKLAGRKARHIYDYGANAGNRAATRAAIGPETKIAEHPMVRVHPETGKPILFVSRLFTVEVLGLPHEEGDALLETLFKHIESRPDDYSHKWQVGDFLVWDNRILQHARNNFPATEKRAMRRVPIADQLAVAQ